MDQGKLKRGVADGVMLLVTAGALLVTVNAVRARRAYQEGPRIVSEWRDIVKVGRATGIADAEVTIIEFGDYECPACRTAQGALDSLVNTIGTTVAVVYVHFPLRQHLRAYAAARAAECAAAEGRFEQMHRVLYSRSEWLRDGDFTRYLDDAGVSNGDEFAKCVNEGGPVERIDRGVNIARELQAPGTPTFIVNGVWMEHLPNAREVSKLVSSGRRRN